MQSSFTPQGLVAGFLIASLFGVGAGIALDSYVIGICFGAGLGPAFALSLSVAGRSGPGCSRDDARRRV